MNLSVLRFETGELLEGQINGRKLAPVDGAAAAAPRTVDGQSGGALAIGQTVSGSVGAGEAVSWTFDGEAGDYVRIDATGFDTFLQLFSADGDLLRENDDGLPDFGSRLLAFLPETAQYGVDLFGALGDGGDYVLELATAEPDPIGDLIAGGQVEGVLGPAGFDLWFFEGQAGQPVRFETTGHDTVMALFGPDLFLIAEDDDGGQGGGSLIELTLDRPGVYAIEIQGFAGAPGAYVLVEAGGDSRGGVAAGFVEIIDELGIIRAEVPADWDAFTATVQFGVILIAAPNRSAFEDAISDSPIRVDADGLLVHVHDLSVASAQRGDLEIFAPLQLSDLDLLAEAEPVPPGCELNSVNEVSWPGLLGVWNISVCPGGVLHVVLWAMPNEPIDSERFLVRFESVASTVPIAEQQDFVISSIEILPFG